MLIYKSLGLKHYNNTQTFIEYSNDKADIYKDRYCWIQSIHKKGQNIVFEDMIADMLTNKKLSPIVTDAFIRGEKLSISLVYIV